MQKVLYAPRAANKKKYEPALFQMSRLDSAPALGTLSREKMVPLLLPRRLHRGPHLDDCARLNGSQRLGASGEVRL